jgi:hypothetical protein
VQLKTELSVNLLKINFKLFLLRKNQRLLLLQSHADSSAFAWGNFKPENLYVRQMTHSLVSCNLR